MVIYSIVIIGGIWSLVRLYRYSFGAYNNYIYVPPWTWISLIVGIWVPILNYIVLTYILLMCRSADKLMTTREQMVKNMSAKDVVDSVDEMILGNNLLNDTWVADTWTQTSTSEWISLLSENPELLKQALDKNAEIHVSKNKLYANWIDVVQHYLYLKIRNAEESIT